MVHFSNKTINIILLLFLFSPNLPSQETNLSNTSLSDSTSGVSTITDLVTLDISSETQTQVEDSSINSVLVPGDDWQIILPNQSIPAGCDVRINLQTGKKEAKWSAGRNTHKFRVPQNYTLSENSTYGSIPIVSVSRDAFQSTNFKSIVKTGNYNTTLNIIELISSTDNTTNIIRYLDELELMLSDGDLALSIALTDNFQVLTQLLISQNFSVSSATSLVLGSMWQNNQQIQLIAIERNVLPSLLGLFQKYNTIEYDLNSILFATSSLLRGLPYGLGMQYFVQFDLVQILTELTTNNIDNHRIIIKAIRFTAFLMEEYETDMRHDAQLGIKRREMVDNIRSSGYCGALQVFKLEGTILEFNSEFDIILSKICE